MQLAGGNGKRNWFSDRTVTSSVLEVLDDGLIVRGLFRTERYAARTDQTDAPGSVRFGLSGRWCVCSARNVIVLGSAMPNVLASARRSESRRIGPQHSL